MGKVRRGLSRLTISKSFSKDNSKEKTPSSSDLGGNDLKNFERDFPKSATLKKSRKGRRDVVMSGSLLQPEPLYSIKEE